jgi:3',5'-cyclic AMP phosphodiesterase CpdA
MSQAVTWRTDDAVTRGVAEIAVAGHGPSFVADRKSVVAKTTPLESELGWVAHFHSAEFTGLEPSTKYAYRVGDGVNWSEWNQFTTASDQPEPFTFIYFGDAQNDLKSHWSRVVREAFRDAPRAAFLLHAGDLVNTANRDAEWGEWHYAGGFIHGITPCIATPGNHEYRGGLSKFWQPGFAFPQNGPPGLEETAYWIDYQCARIISLNSNERQQEQVAWLEKVLAENDRPWTIITFHHPMYSSAAGRDNKELREMWMPVFDKYKVDIVLQGHDHTYARSRLLTVENVDTGVTAQSPESGTMYVVSVSGPKMYKLGRRPFMRRAAQDTQLYQILHVSPNRLEYEARTATGMKYDGFALVKRPGMSNQLIEQTPDTPELVPDDVGTEP